MKKIVPVLLILVIVVLLIGGGFFLLPRALYLLPPFQSWVAGQISEQSGGTFEFDGIEGDAFEARLAGSWLDLRSGQSNVLQAKFDDLTATFELLPVAAFKLVLKEVHARGGDILLDLKGGAHEQIRLPVNAELFTMSGGRLAIQNLQGYHLMLEEVELTVNRTDDSKHGEFSSPTGKIGTIELSGVAGEFHFGPEGLTVNRFQAKIAGNSDLSAKGKILLSQEDTPMEDVEIEVKTSQVKDLLAAIGYSQNFDGQADVSLKTSGVFRPERKDLQGSGEATLTGVNAKVRLPSYPIIEQSGILNELREIKQLGGTVPFKLAGNMIQVSPLELKNQRLSTKGDLKVGYDRSISGSQVLTTNAEIAAMIPEIARDAFKSTPDGGRIIPFRFTGTTNAPSVETDGVIAKVLSNPLNAVKQVGGTTGGILGGLFGGGKKKEAASESAEQASEAATNASE